MGQAKRLFGTDGIRGLANRFPMTPDLVMKVGQAFGYILHQRNPLGLNKQKVLIGKDTRISGYMIEQALSCGLNSMGIDTLFVGPLPTPGIGFLTQNMRASSGVVISASHNPYYDNGIKIFGHDGFKISDDFEREIERLVETVDLNSLLPTETGIGRSKRIEDAAGRYIVHVKNTFPLNHTLEGMRIVLDCANGSSYKVAPAVLTELGAEVILIGDTPNGLNINDKCGALHTELMIDAVKTYRADIGISLDGDADRVILADETGEIVNGDHILAICGLDLKKRNQLTNNTVVTTEMSNFGLEKLFQDNQIKLIKTKVGDKNVVDEMRKNNFILGGEASGHIIFIKSTTTGDGMIAALKILSIMKENSKKLSVLKSVMKDMPQILKNFPVKNKKELTEIKGYSELLEKINKELKGNGRTFVRYSGTENLVRVMIEGNNSENISKYADEIGHLLIRELAK